MNGCCYIRSQDISLEAPTYRIQSTEFWMLNRGREYLILERMQILEL